MCLPNLPGSKTPSSTFRDTEMEAACVLSSMMLSDCSLSFCLPGTQMRRCIKSPLNLRLLCLFFFKHLSHFMQWRKAPVQLAAIKQSVPARIESCCKRHVHTLKCQVSHTNYTHQLNQSLKVSEASISFCKSAAIQQWVLFPLSLDVGFWPVGRGLFMVSVSACVDF